MQIKKLRICCHGLAAQQMSMTGTEETENHKNKFSAIALIQLPNHDYSALSVTYSSAAMGRQPVKHAHYSYDTLLQLHKSKGHIINQPGLHPCQALNNLQLFSCQNNYHPSSGSFRHVLSFWYFAQCTPTELSVCPQL